MSINEQIQIKTTYFNEAIRYMENAKDVLKKAGKDDDYYADDKYVKMATGTAYSAVLKALDGFFILKEVKPVKKGSRASKQYYEKNLTVLDKKLLKYFETVYRVLHLEGYYEGETYVSTIQSGFTAAYSIIEKIKP